VAPPIRIGTRGSRLALAQTQLVVDALRATAPGREVTTVEVRSEGDLQPDVPLQELGIGVFTGALERALLDGRIDMAVHSLKDLPTQPSPGLIVLSVLERADPRDVLINRWGHGLLDLPAGARIGTSSPRREAQLRHGRSDLDYLPIRGNVETRIAKADGDDYDGVVIAAAGVERLGLRDRIAVSREAGAELFISVHADAIKNSAIRGLSVYTLSEKASDKEAAALADKENKADLIAGIDLSKETPEVTNILIDLAQRESMNQSAHFAARLVKELARETKLLRNTHRFAGFVVLKAPDVPSVLMELGFLSNRQDEAALKRKSYRAKLIAAMARAADAYFSRIEEAVRP